jgi:6-phosphogluconolactonase (cycloisomerase 2 family)
LGESGDVALHGEPVTLPYRPVHITTDRDSRFAFITYPAPSHVGAHPIASDGTLGPELAEVPRMPPLAKVAHQFRFSPDGRLAALPLRGNPADHGDNGEDPGALEIFAYDSGRLTHRQTIAPDGGYGFGPRHVDFHPSQPWLYLSVERQNELALFTLGDRVEGPVHRATTLAHPGAVKPRQLVGAIHVHPSGRYVYVSNRADGTVEAGGHKVFNGGENTIAVFEIDPRSGYPTLIQTEDTRGMHPRTFSIDSSGRILVAANMTTRDVLEGGTRRNVPGGLSIFRIGEDGRLTFVRKIDVDATADHLFWSGFVAP